jgi:hypothetical protein
MSSANVNAWSITGSVSTNNPYWRITPDWPASATTLTS